MAAEKMTEKILKLCSDTGIKQNRLAKLVGMNSDSLYRKLDPERSEELSAYEVARIARYFGVSADWLFDDSRDDSDPGKFDRSKMKDRALAEFMRVAREFGGVIEAAETSEMKFDGQMSGQAEDDSPGGEGERKSS